MHTHKIEATIGGVLTSEKLFDHYPTKEDLDSYFKELNFLPSDIKPDKTGTIASFAIKDV